MYSDIPIRFMEMFQDEDEHEGTKRFVMNLLFGNKYDDALAKFVKMFPKFTVAGNIELSA